ncbi:MAG: hypothetical protein PHQ81_05305, partial [Methanofollis sp.]|nr:hypothetical protein [Methanofollis sp.]
MRVDLAFKAYFRRVKAGENPGYPRFKGKGRYDSIGDVKTVLHRPVEGTIKTLTIRRSSTGKWYACFSVEYDPSPAQQNDGEIGIDVGLESFATLSN